jgi:hypothetical protein
VPPVWQLGKTCNGARQLTQSPPPVPYRDAAAEGLDFAALLPFDHPGKSKEWAQRWQWVRKVGAQ